jgi:uncharacterized protein
LADEELFVVSVSTGAVKPWRAIVAAWFVLAVITLVFAADIDRYATAGGSLGADILAQGSGGLSQAAQALGISPARASAAETMKSLYAAAPVVAAFSAAAPAEVQLQTASAVAGAITAAAQTGKVQRVLIIGDSFIEAQIGSKLDDLLTTKYGLTVKRFGQRSTGLARPDFFNWPKTVADMKAEFKPDLIIGSWGANDCQALTGTDGKVVAKFDTKEWDTEYARRVTMVVGEMTEGGCRAVVVGLPAMRSRSLNTRMLHLNGVAEKAVEAAGATFMPVWQMSVGPDGKYLSSIKVNGQDKLLRMADGVHFSGPGAEYVAEQLCADMAKTYGWMKK